MDEKELKRFLHNMLEHVNELDDRGDLRVGVLHDDDSGFIIMEGWRPVYILYTYLAIEAGCYDLYQNALDHADKSDQHGTALLTIIPGPAPELFPDVYLDNKREYRLLDDLRLGTDGKYPDSQYHTPFQIPSPLDEYVEEFWKVFGEYGFSDEFDTCGACGKIIKTSPDSYSWQPDFVLTEDGYVHVDCLDTDDVLESHKNQEKALPPQIQDRAIDQGLLVELSEHNYENGMHPGMNDDPKKIIKAFKKAGIDCWFNVQPSQFYVEFTVMVRPEDEKAANDLLTRLDVYQGYDTAEEMSKALRGEHSDHIQVKTTTITPEDFVEGNF